MRNNKSKKLLGFSSILGMNLFGCKFCDVTAGKTCRSEQDADKDRKNFDSLLWAIVTVFQVQPFLTKGSLFGRIALQIY